MQSVFLKKLINLLLAILSGPVGKFSTAEVQQACSFNVSMAFINFQTMNNSI